jgi:ABC-type sugar transport system ATPase subunit
MDAGGIDLVPVRLRGLTKSFPGVSALRDVDLDILASEVHGLVGENGAGKSTLIKHIVGVYRPDGGTVELFGKSIDHADPRVSQKAGVGVIYQERSIVPELSASANVFLGRTKNLGPFVSRRLTRQRFKELADSLGADIDPDARAGSLSVANQQLLEIMRALDADHRILVMDEPTTALGAPERRRLYAIVDGLRRQGLAIIFISHDLDEVLALCDRVTVMRDGALVATKPVGDWSKATLVGAMLGNADLGRAARRKASAGDEILRVEGLSVPGHVEDISFVLRKGEILGIAGLIGSGRSEILRALAGADKGAQGRLYLDGRERPLPRTVTRALDYGIALAPEDRKEQGLVLSLNGVANVTLPRLEATAHAGIVSEPQRLAAATAVVDRLGFDAGRLGAPVATLSGGNQQKLVIAKWLYCRPKILLLDEPTQGIDVGAKAEIFNVVAELADGGMAVIFVSSEFEEVVDVADRILVVGNGRALGLIERADASVKRILDILFNVGGQA